MKFKYYVVKLDILSNIFLYILPPFGLGLRGIFEELLRLTIGFWPSVCVRAMYALVWDRRFSTVFAGSSTATDINIYMHILRVGLKIKFN